MARRPVPNRRSGMSKIIARCRDHGDLRGKDGRTLLVLSELYPSKEALDEAPAGMAEAMPEQFAQLDELLVTLGASRTDG